MNEKKLIFDVVLIQNDINVFELRFKKLYETVDYFLIFGDTDSLENLKKFYGVIDHKIKTFILNSNYHYSSQDNEFITQSILSSIENLYKTFEDYVFISFDNEIPDIKSLTVEDFTSKEVSVLMNDVYVLNFERKKKYPESGSVLMNFSHILKNKKNFFSDAIRLKKEVYQKDTTILNGFKILDFKKNLEDEVEFYTCPKSKIMIQFKNIRESKKFTFFINHPVIESKSNHSFELKFIDYFPEKIKIDLSEVSHKLEIFLPKEKLYGKDIQSFKSDYRLNEVMRVLSIFNCQNEDEIEIYYDENKLKKFKYGEIKNPSF